jgi:hypothetical protein
MSNGITSNGLPPRSDPAVEFVRAANQAAAHDPAPQPVVQPPAPVQDTRLNIERDQASGEFVYKFVDPQTGQVIEQIPNKELLKLRASASYTAGRVVDTKA